MITRRKLLRFLDIIDCNYLFKSRLLPCPYTRVQNAKRKPRHELLGGRCRSRTGNLSLRLSSQRSFQSHPMYGKCLHLVVAISLIQAHNLCHTIISRCSRPSVNASYCATQPSDISTLHQRRPLAWCQLETCSSPIQRQPQANIISRLEINFLRIGRVVTSYHNVLGQRNRSSKRWKISPQQPSLANTDCSWVCHTGVVLCRLYELYFFFGPEHVTRAGKKKNSNALAITTPAPLSRSHTAWTH
jgi:hypothetical protein